MRCSRDNAVAAGGVCCVEYAEVEQNLAGTVGGAAIVFARRARSAPGESSQACSNSCRSLSRRSDQGAAGLNQQSGDDLRPDR